MHTSNRIPRHAPGRQRGVAMVLTAAFILAGLVALALAIDVGRLYAAQQRLQKSAEMAALNAARYVGGCRELSGSSTLDSVAQKTAQANYDTRTSGKISVQVVTGGMASDNDLRHFDPDPPDRPYAVVVTATDNDFHPLFLSLFGGSPALTATAGAINRPKAEIGMGTTLAGVNPKLLSQLLPINIGAAQEGDLANLPISLANLLNIDANVITKQQLLNTSINDALTNIGNLVSGQVSGLVDQIAGLLPADTGQTSLLDILDVAGSVGSQVKVDAGAIVNAAALLAASDRDKPATIPLNLNVPGIASVTASVRVLQPPVVAVGPPGRKPNGDFYTQARTSQIAVTLHIALLKVPGITLIDLPLVVQGAQGTASLARIDCASAARPYQHVVIDTQTNALRAGVGLLQDVSGNGDFRYVPGQAVIAKLLGLPILSVKGQTNIAGSQASPAFDIRDPEADLPASRSIGGEATVQQLLGGINLTPVLLGSLPLPVGQLLQPVTGLLLGPLAGTLNTVLSQLGLSLGTGNAQLISLHVQQPQLFCDSEKNCFRG